MRFLISFVFLKLKMKILKEEKISRENKQNREISSEKFDINTFLLKRKTDFLIDPDSELHHFYQLSLYHQYLPYNLLEKLIKPLIEPVFLLILSQKNLQKTLFQEKNLEEFLEFREEITKEILLKYHGLFLSLQEEKNRDFLMNLSLFSTVLIVFRILLKNFTEKTKKFNKEFLYEFFRILFSTIYEMEISFSFIEKTAKGLYKDDFFEKIAVFAKEAKTEVKKEEKTESFLRKAFFFEDFLRKKEEISTESPFFEEFRRDLKGKLEFKKKKEINFVKNTEKIIVEKNSLKNVEFFSRKIDELSQKNGDFSSRKNSANSSGFLKKFSIKNANKTSASFRIFSRSSSQKRKPAIFHEKQPIFEEKPLILRKKSEKIRGFSAKKKKLEKETSQKMQRKKGVFLEEVKELKETLDFVHEQLKKTVVLVKNTKENEVFCRNSREKIWFLQEKLGNAREKEKNSSLSGSLEKKEEKIKVFSYEKIEKNLKKNQMKFLNEEKTCKKVGENDDFFEEMKEIMLNRKENQRFFYKKKKIKVFQQLRRVYYEENRSPDEKIEEIGAKILQKRENLVFFLKNPTSFKKI